MSYTDIERKFIDRKTSDEEEASIMAAVPKGRWQWLEAARERRDLARRWEHLESMLPGVVASMGDANQDTGQRLCVGIAFLIEEIHHLNETMAMDRRGR